MAQEGFKVSSSLVYSAEDLVRRAQRLKDTLSALYSDGSHSVDQVRDLIGVSEVLETQAAQLRKHITDSVMNSAQWGVKERKKD